MADLTTKQQQTLLKSVKAGKTQGAIATELGLTPGQLGMKAFCDAQVEAGLVPSAPGTETSVKKLRAAGARWELIAAQTSLSVAKVKELAGDATPVARGRKASNGSGSKATGVKVVANARGARGKTAAPARARTRAERAARSGNPS